MVNDSNLKKTYRSERRFTSQLLLGLKRYGGTGKGVELAFEIGFKTSKYLDSRNLGNLSLHFIRFSFANRRNLYKVPELTSKHSIIFFRKVTAHMGRPETAM